MLAKIVKPGDKLELTKANVSVTSSEKFSKNIKKETYFSKIYDIIGEDKLKIAMPMDGTHLIFPAINTRYELSIHTKGGIYHCKGIVIERYKEASLHVMILEVYTGIQKFQRRQHYRFACNLIITYRVLSQAEASLLTDSDALEAFRDALSERGYLKGVTLDISGGGIRFTSAQLIEPDTSILCNFSIDMEGKKNSFSVISRLVQSKEMPHRKNQYEHRVKFDSISDQDRETLIRFIFEEERRYRKNKKG